MERLPSEVQALVIRQLDLFSLGRLASASKQLQGRVWEAFSGAPEVPCTLFVHGYFACLKSLWWGADDAARGAPAHPAAPPGGSAAASFRAAGSVSALQAVKKQAWMCQAETRHWVAWIMQQQQQQQQRDVEEQPPAPAGAKQHSQRDASAQSAIDTAFARVVGMAKWLFQRHPHAQAFLPGQNMPEGWPLPFALVHELQHACPALRHLDVSGARLVHNHGFTQLQVGITDGQRSGDGHAHRRDEASGSGSGVHLSNYQFVPYTFTSDGWTRAFVKLVLKMKALRSLNLTFCYGLGTGELASALERSQCAAVSGMFFRLLFG